MAHVVALPVCDGMTLFEYGIAVEALGFAWGDVTLDYDVRACGPAGGVHTVGGAILTPGFGLADIATADTVIVTAVTDPRRNSNPEWTEYLRAAAGNGARMVSICSGAFALAEAGLLDGRRATTHWRYASLLQHRFPRVHVTPSDLYVRDGNVTTGAGSAAGLDLCFKLIREDHGPATANEVARRMVVAPHRDGDQSQFVTIDALRPDVDARFADFLESIAHCLDTVAGVDEMATRAGVSRRTLHRQFKRHTGSAPLEWLVRQRVYRAMGLLETTDEPVTAVAARAGFDAEETLRYHFKRQTGLNPTAYRDRFRSQRDEAIF
ncbi:Transcriptional regulator, AraC family OS=Tsukamurella paurometabola (strain ATCC 8368 / DSM/ CCUG 35730 / CIP 100753 / JCM 10117 / KCTC 9821 / NBRC 16120/ NCIMB 702349 / NCTC 13040) OX=521096 GN=Tpau_4043 PE=4 SV=1 [Tsukamurella paurometabola]|uniref:Transcriptional regulator, AraC family n=1 Tax=Tsukamurella paurometabola (strain ATCC 8368 / DSM 20162 / CCUG 35730 / CIP 100753 / JCM 10117 / KCTC 9821 / NBRC 16120 / NCIMB 702349 / NCTC 13040) TaxID=521096 RepID=D5UNB9_TSUPD|nr:helix-turn-helix domain-containing protein [Tsukamurella paurometabola]ADG80614.1 transcriptional regulator, AraC family [Tsukamurella paurometabola DSM 20162]SUP40292.1 Multiple antibiotic resistance protein marA [Tsukamurella paurometabola]